MRRITMVDESQNLLCRKVTCEQLSAYEVDGVAVLRDVLDCGWIERMRRAIDCALDDPSQLSTEYTPRENPGRFYIEYFMWRRSAEFRAFMQDSPLPGIAAQLIHGGEIRLFYDQLFVKEATTNEPTPWHQDLSYWPLAGNDILSMWVPFDAVTRDTGGLVYVKGSHRWCKLFRPVGFSPGSEFDQMYKKVNLEELPDINSCPHEYELAHWDVGPGDVIVHHPLTIHCAGGNRSQTARRRAISLRYIGQDVRYDGRPGTFLQSPKLGNLLPPITLQDGDVISGELFPRVWPLCREGA
jgi:ectoine hydroxylase-related dioxygenase (phytanoyl-CoA dioxygenase family)